jgi:hypothetical protein
MVRRETEALSAQRALRIGWKSVRMGHIFSLIRPKSKRSINMAKNITRINLALTGAAAILICACSIANLGWLRNSPDVERAFETLQVSPNYRYWYLYLENNPYAVLGLNREYRFEDIMWTEVEPGSEAFGKVVGLVESFPVPGSRTYGAYILDAKGERIGVWYSSMSAGITVDPDTKVVVITTGTPWMNGDGNDNGRD